MIYLIVNKVVQKYLEPNGIFTSDLWIQLLETCLRQSTLKSPVKLHCWIKIAKYTSKHHLSDYFHKTLYLRYAEAAIQKYS